MSSTRAEVSRETHCEASFLSSTPLPPPRPLSSPSAPRPRDGTRVAGIRTEDGAITHSGKRGLDVFASADEALSFLREKHSGASPTTVAKGDAVLGFARNSKFALLLLATK